MSARFRAAANGARRKMHKASLMLVNEHTSSAFLRLEIQVPMHKIRERSEDTMEFLTGDRLGTWSDLVTGRKVSTTMSRLSYMFCTLTYVAALFIGLKKPQMFPLFWVAMTGFLCWCRYQIFSRTAGVFYFLDYCYFVAALQTLLFTFMSKSATLWKTTFALQTGMSLWSCFFMPTGNLISLSSSTYGVSAISNMQLVFIHFMPSVALMLDLENKRQTDYGLYNKITSEYASSKDMMMDHILYPFAVFCVWEVIYLFLTEGVFSSTLYQSVLRDIYRIKGTDYGTTLKYYFNYYRPHVNKKFPRKQLASTLRSLGLVPSTVKYSPEKRSSHHTFTVMALVLMQAGMAATLLPVSYLMLRNQALFQLMLSGMFVMMVYFGAKKAYPDEKPRRVKAKKETESVSTWESSDEEDLNEGGDLPGDRWDLNPNNISKKNSEKKVTIEEVKVEDVKYTESNGETMTDLTETSQEFVEEKSLPPMSVGGSQRESVVAFKSDNDI